MLRQPCPAAVWDTFCVLNIFSPPPSVPLQVPRFDVVVMFLDDHEKQPARDLIAALEKGATPDPQVKDKTLALFKQAYDV